jgi:ribonucleoside-diphosphate reductase beta chain
VRFELLPPLELYRLWERQSWVSHQIDLSRDREDWARLPETVQRELLFGIGGFFVGEERVANQFSGLVMAAEDKHEEAFLLTQQVDEARHAQHFNRLYEEVFALDGTFEQRLEVVRRSLGADFVELFDGHLVDAHRALLRDPSDLGAKVDFVVTYHMVIEGLLALTGQHFQTLNLERLGIMPGHLEAFRLIAQDEHRHVAYGTWFLQRHAADPDLRERMRVALDRALPAAAGVLVPRRREPFPGYETADAYGQAMNEFAFSALSRRLKLIGVPPPAATSWHQPEPRPAVSSRPAT